MKIQLDFFVLIYEGALKVLSFTYQDLWTYQYFNLKNEHLVMWRLEITSWIAFM